MTDRQCLAILTAILLNAIRYEDDGSDGKLLNDPREQMLDAMFMAGLIWREACERERMMAAADVD